MAEAFIGQKVLEVVEHVCGLSPQELKRIRTMLDDAEATRPPQKGGS